MKLYRALYFKVYLLAIVYQQTLYRTLQPTLSTLTPIPNQDHTGWLSIFPKMDTGNTFAVPTIDAFLERNSHMSKSWSSLCIQGPESLTCGQYCVYWLYHTTRHVPTREVLYPFSKDRPKNDCMINSWLNSNFNVKTQCHDKSVQSCTEYKY